MADAGKHTRATQSATERTTGELTVRPLDASTWPAFSRLVELNNGAAYERSQTTAPDWRIACCFVGKGHRRQGVATAGLAGALDLIAADGGGVVEGYPEDAESVLAGFLYNGALSTYEKLGFERDRKIGKHRWVMRTVVQPRK